MPTQEAPQWVSSAIPGLPEELLPSGQAIEGAYLNSGRMSGGLARLQSSTILLKQASSKCDTSAEHVRKNVSRLLNGMHKDVKELLMSMQERLDDEMDGVRSRVRKEQSATLAAVDRHIELSVSAVEETLQTAGNDVRNEFLSALDFLKECGAVLQQDINTTERGYMRTLAQLIISNSWTTSWPVAVRTFQQDNGETQAHPPPQYAATSATATRPVNAANAEVVEDPPSMPVASVGTTEM
ncbi:hypothetical protein CF326_g6078 [Tilletia indica]|nr:hypothetical protein CF326_g6078 [Tilletia indica]